MLKRFPKNIFLFSFLVSLLFLSSTLHARDLSNRLGIGYINNLGFSLPSIATTYYPNADIGITGAIGVDTEEFNSKFGAQAGVRKIIFKEDNMNFFMGSTLALISQEVSGTARSGFEINGHIGGEFFLPHLDSLSFTFTTGIGVTSLSKVRFRTLAESPLTAGMMFYF
jgi:hypothetical protein